MNKKMIGAAIAGAILLGGTAAQAAPMALNLLSSVPDISINNISGSVGGNAFTVTGSPVTLDIDGGGADYNIIGSAFSLDAILDNDGDLVSGTVSISGMVFGTSYSGMLTGDLTAFGYGGDNTPFEFEFDITGLSVNGGSVPLGSYTTGGIIMSSPGFDGTLGNPFASAQSISGAVADAFATSSPTVVEPWTILLMGPALIALCAVARRARA